MAHTQDSVTNLYDSLPPGLLLYASSTTYGSDWISMFHAHSFSELFYILDGDGEFCIGDSRIPLRKDMLMIVNPNVKHTEKSSPDKPLTYIVLGIDNLQFDFCPSQASTHHTYDFRLHRRDIFPLLEMILDELKQKKDSYGQVSQHLLTVLLCRILRITGDAFSLCSHENVPAECQKIRDYIDTHYHTEITLDSLSTMAHLNKFYLSHLFSDSYGISPINYLLERRILQSKQLLKNSDYSITQIASMTGFSSPNYFAQVFKKSTGFTPRSYRSSRS